VHENVHPSWQHLSYPGQSSSTVQLDADADVDLAEDAVVLSQFMDADDLIAGHSPSFRPSKLKFPITTVIIARSKERLVAVAISGELSYTVC